MFVIVKSVHWRRRSAVNAANDAQRRHWSGVHQLVTLRVSLDICRLKFSMRFVVPGDRAKSLFMPMR